MGLGIFFVFGLVMCVSLNFLVIVVLLKKGRAINYMDMLMISLSVSDLLQAGIGYTVELHSYYSGKPIDGVPCQIAAFSTTFLGLVSISHLAGIAVERHVILRYPIKMRIWLEHPTISLYVIIPSWMYGLLWALFPLLGWNRYTRQPGINFSCSIDLTTTDFNCMSYNYSILVACFLLPMIMITYCSYSIYGSLKNRRSISEILNMGNPTIEQRKKMERQQSVTSLVLIAAFVFCWSPYAGCVLALTIKGYVPRTLFTIATIFAKTSTLYNPIIYSLLVEDFRLRCKRLFHCGKKTSLLSTELSTQLSDELSTQPLRERHSTQLSTILSTELSSQLSTELSTQLSIELPTQLSTAIYLTLPLLIGSSPQTNRSTSKTDNCFDELKGNVATYNEDVSKKTDTSTVETTVFFTRHNNRSTRR